jgi:hypothetical protein
MNSTPPTHSLSVLVVPKDTEIIDFENLPCFANLESEYDGDVPIQMIPRQVLQYCRVYGKLPNLKAIRYTRLLEPSPLTRPGTLQYAYTLPRCQTLSLIGWVQEFRFEGEATLIMIDRSGTCGKLFDSNWIEGEPDVWTRKLISGEKLFPGPIIDEHKRPIIYYVRCLHPVTAVVVDFDPLFQRSFSPELFDPSRHGFKYDTVVDTPATPEELEMDEIRMKLEDDTFCAAQETKIRKHLGSKYDQVKMFAKDYAKDTVLVWHSDAVYLLSEEPNMRPIAKFLDAADIDYSSPESNPLKEYTRDDPDMVRVYHRRLEINFLDWPFKTVLRLHK